MTERDVLPQRRHSRTVTFYRGSIAHVATVGRYEDGRLGEIFLRAAKTGTDVQISGQEAAILLSFALQYGCPLDTLRRAMPRDHAGVAEGAIGTLLDLLAEEAGPDR